LLVCGVWFIPRPRDRFLGLGRAEVHALVFLPLILLDRISALQKHLISIAKEMILLIPPILLVLE